MKIPRHQLQNRLNEIYSKTSSPYLLRRKGDTPKKGNSASRRATKRVKHLARKQRRKFGITPSVPKKKKVKREKIIYAEYIKSKEWRARCKLFYELTGRFCKACGETQHLNVHHMSYYHLGFEHDSDLIVLCQPCHQEYHELNGVQSDMISKTKYYVETKRKSIF